MAAFNPKEFIKILKRDLSKKERRDMFTNLFNSKTFKEWMFAPNKNDLETKMMADEIFDLLIHKKNIEAIILSVVDNSYEFSRSVGAFIHSVYNWASEVGSSRINELVELRKKGDLSEKVYKEQKEKAENYLEIISALESTAKKIIKPFVKSISKRSGIDKDLIKSILLDMPEAEYIPSAKVGVYMNFIMPKIYGYVEDTEPFSRLLDTLFGKEKSYSELFTYLFGEDKLCDVAMFVLLEGVHRLNKYNNPDIRKVWDSITDWALHQLESSPEILRNQMIELYIKKVSKMFENDSYDLRCDLLKLSKDLFPNLVASIDKYRTKIKEITKK